MAFSDGMCQACARRWRAEARGEIEFVSPSPLVPAWMPRVGIAIVLVSALLFAAKPVDRGIRVTGVTPAPVAREWSGPRPVAAPADANVAAMPRVLVEPAAAPQGSRTPPGKRPQAARSDTDGRSTLTRDVVTGWTAVTPARTALDRFSAAARTVAMRVSTVASPLVCRPVPSPGGAPPAPTATCEARVATAAPRPLLAVESP